MKLSNKAPGTSSTRFKIVQSFNLAIEQAIKDDEGMYFCAVGEGNAISFSKGTFLAVAGQPQLNISVLQTPVWGSVSPGEPVTLQCTVLPDLRAAGLPVLWFRDAAGQSFPEVIYTPQKTGSHQCEFSSPTNSCMYNFSISNFSQSDAGTYYCAVAACGRIIVGNGASVYLGGPVNPVVMFLGAVLLVCVFVILAQTFIICKWRKSGHCSGKWRPLLAFTLLYSRHSIQSSSIFLTENKAHVIRCFRKVEKSARLSSREDNPSDSVQAVGNSEALVISAKPGQAVTLNCMFANESGVDVKMWYKQRLEHAPLEVGTHLEGKSGMISNKFDRSRYKISRTASGVSLRIEGVTKEDEGMYFCGAAGTKTLDFSNSTFLAVTGQLDISVLQTPVQGSVSPGESVTLQCTVLSEIRAADLRVLWFRAAAGQSFPEIIYTHQNSSSRQCEISSSTHSSVYNLSRNILNHHHTGTYYCAVAACGRIIFEHSTTVELDSVQAVRKSEASVISAEPGQAVTLNCMFANESGVDVKMWYKQRLEHAPLEVGTQLEGKSGMISNKFDRSRYKISRTASGVSLRIERVTKEDEGMYFCGAAGTKTLDFSNSTFLAVTGQLNISVLQTPVQGPVSPGESVTLQCTVLSEVRAADLRVLWFRAAAGQSFPEIIYTHQNSSSRQCEISSSTHSSVYSFSRNILNHHHTGTYYCAVAAFGKIIFGNGTAVELNSHDHQSMLIVIMGVALVLSVMGNIWSWMSASCSGKSSQSVSNSFSEVLLDKDTYAEEFDVTALLFSEKMKRSALEENVFTRVSVCIYCLNNNPFIDAAGAVDIYQRQSFVSTKPGEAVTLQCTLADRQSKEDVFWYKQPLGQMPQQVGIKGAFMKAILSPRFQNSGFKLERMENSISLTIPHPTKDDEGMYYCGISVMKMIQFSNGTFLSVTDHPQLNISVRLTPSQGSVSPGESVTLQCTVLSEIRAADLRVLWFRAAAGQSFPEIIYTHQNSSSRQCESSSSTHCSVYKFSKKKFSFSDAGTYYCAVATCGMISVGNGLTVGIDDSVSHPSALLVVTGLALGLCAVWSIALCCCCMKGKPCECCGGELIEGRVFYFCLLFRGILMFCFSVHVKALSLTLTHMISQEQTSYQTRTTLDHIVVSLGIMGTAATPQKY
ncbi:hypothetical protein NFI96_031882 [Prochilodus magdalenae]|nr:hypothetical protein NFI96_031882 [Prochilodus magdalenae]